MKTKYWHASDPRTNALLAALPDDAWDRWEPHLRFVDLENGEALAPCSAQHSSVIFPTTAIVSLLCTMQDGASTEVCVIGNDGAVGLSLSTGGDGLPGEPVVQNAGQGYRLPVKLVTDEISRGGPVLNIMLRYSQTMFAQVARTALCNRYHSIDEQLCRRLLMGLDRSPSDELSMTHEGMARLLGVRRESVSAAAYKLQLAGVIRYHRGRVVVEDREELEQRACECYSVARGEPSLLPRVPVGAWLQSRTAGVWARRGAPTTNTSMTNSVIGA